VTLIEILREGISADHEQEKTGDNCLKWTNASARLGFVAQNLSRDDYNVVLNDQTLPDCRITTARRGKRTMYFFSLQAWGISPESCLCRLAFVNIGIFSYQTPEVPSSSQWRKLCRAEVVQISNTIHSVQGIKRRWQSHHLKISHKFLDHLKICTWKLSYTTTP
jgi:hypothetical protein